MKLHVGLIAETFLSKSLETQISMYPGACNFFVFPTIKFYSNYSHQGRFPTSTMQILFVGYDIIFTQYTVLYVISHQLLLVHILWTLYTSFHINRSCNLLSKLSEIIRNGEDQKRIFVRYFRVITLGESIGKVEIVFLGY